jgi:Flp pilus assembly secretin CpaC
LTVTFASATPSICTVSGSTATMNAAGACVIHATQAGNSTYAPAQLASQLIVVTTH